MTQDTPAADQLGGLLGASVGDFVTVLIKEFGGPALLAREVHHEYCNLPDNSPQKTRMLSLIMQLWDKHGTDSSSDDPDELEAEAARLEAEEAAAG